MRTYKFIYTSVITGDDNRDCSLWTLVLLCLEEKLGRYQGIFLPMGNALGLVLKAQGVPHPLLKRHLAAKAQEQFQNEVPP